MEKGTKYRLPHAPKGKCTTGIWFNEKHVKIELVDQCFDLKKSHYEGGLRHEFEKALKLNGFTGA